VTDEKRPGHDWATGGLRFLTELIAWVGAPWALWQHSVPLAIGAVVLLIGLPALFSTPGDRPGGGALISVPGSITILLVLMQLAVAATAAWLIWPRGISAAVTLLCLIVTFTEQPRWRSLVRRPRASTRVREP
jgi:hypothetical protein